MNDKYRSSIKPKNPQYLRNTNRAEILRYLVTKGTASRIELSKNLNLTKMGISKIVSELQQDNLIEEGGIINDISNQQSGSYSGRKPTAINIPNYRINTIGISIFRYQIKGIAADIKGNIFYSEKVSLPVGTDNEKFIDLTIALIDKIMTANKNFKFIGIGIASIGPLDIHRQKILNPPNFRNIRDVSIGDIIRERFSLPVFLENDMNAAALAEHLYGIAKDTGNIVYLGIGSGVGAGIIINGNMLHGSGGYAGEIGHISIKSDGPKCSCGRNGCLELYTNTLSLLQSTGAASVEKLLEELSLNLSGESTQQIVDSYVEAVLNALVTIVNIFDPEIVIIGDEGALLVSQYLKQLEEDMNTLMFQNCSQKIKLAVSSFGESAPLVGAAATVFQNVFNGILPVD